MAFNGIWAMDIHPEPSCGRTMNPDMVLSSSLSLDVTMAPGGSTGHQIGLMPMAAWLSDTNMTSGGGTDPWHLHGL